MSTERTKPDTGAVTSPRLRGEVDRTSARSGEGESLQTTLVETGPSPRPSPRKSGEREGESASGEREREGGARGDMHSAATPGIRPRTYWQRNEKWLLGTISMAAFLMFWELSVALDWVNPLFTSSPSRIALAAHEMFADG